MSGYVVDWQTRISSDHDTVDRFLAVNDGETLDAPSVADLGTAIEWLALYGAEYLDDAAPFMRVIGFLQYKVAEKERRDRITEAKRQYAQDHGVPVSSVRIAR